MRKKNSYSRIVQAVIYWGEKGKNHEKGKMINMLHSCVEHDITSFDSDDFVGNSIGRTFGTALSESGLSRDKIQLISKYVPSNDPQINLISKVDEILLTLRTDYLDLLLLDYDDQPQELLQTIERLTSQGKIVEVGGLNLQKAQMETLKKSLPLRANQIEPSYFSEEIKKEAGERSTTFEGITDMLWCPEDIAEDQTSSAVFQKLCSKYNTGTFQLFLSWLLQHPAHIHPVISFTEEADIEKAVASKNIALDPVDWQKINLLLT